MGSIWTIRPEDVTRELTYTDPTGGTHPFWVKLKKRLTVGEERKVMTAGWQGIKSKPGTKKGDANESEIQIDWRMQSFARAAAFLTDWSLEDDDHKKLPLTVDQLEVLNPDVFALIEDAITAHVEAADEEKKAPRGNDKPSTMSA